MRQIRLVVLAVVAGLAGCATLNEDQCRSADWYELGLRDGSEGEPRSLLLEHREACAEYGVHPNTPRYMEGRRHGLRDYCRIDNAFQSGLDGHQYQGVCPPGIDLKFRRYNAAAYDVHETRLEIEKVDDQLSDKERQLLNKKLKDEKRRDLRQEIRDLDRERARLRDDLRYREQELDRLRRQAGRGK